MPRAVTRTITGGELVTLASKATINVVGLHIDDWPVVQVPLFSTLVLFELSALEPRHHNRQQVFSIRTKKNLEGEAHLAAVNAFEVKAKPLRTSCFGAHRLPSGLNEKLPGQHPWSGFLKCIHSLEQCRFEMAGLNGARCARLSRAPSR